MTDAIDLREFIAGFLAEAEELIRSARRNILAVDVAIQKGLSEPRAIRELFRSLHTMKGLAGMVGIDPIVDLAHGMESVLRGADKAGGRLPENAVQVIVDGLDAIEQRVGALARGLPVPPAPGRLIERLDGLVPADGPTDAFDASRVTLDPELAGKLGSLEREQIAAGVASGRRAFKLDFTPSPEHSEAGLTITSVRERMAAIAEIVKVLPISVPRSEGSPTGLKFSLLVVSDASPEALAAIVGAPAEAVIELTPPPAAPAAPVEEELPDYEPARRGIVRVDVARLDEAMENLSALVVTRSRLARAVAVLGGEGASVRALRSIVEENGRQLRDLRAGLLRLRMVSVAALLEPIPLMVRGLRAATGKLARVEIDAGGAELDKSVGERIFPAIVHLVRNAVDHGIEAPEQRRQRGKPEIGLLRITCFTRSNSQLELRISDDGGGIDREALARRAGREVPRTSAALLDLLAVPGLSIRAHATTTSGRGLGMDIVKRIVDELGGALMVSEETGAGTTFTLRVPLTVSIVDAFSFECAGQPFVVSMAMVDEIVDLEPSRTLSSPRSSSIARDRDPVRLLVRRGEAVPLVSLAALLALPPSRAPIAKPGTKALIVSRNGAPYAFAVDRVIGQQEVVVRPLEDPLVHVRGVSGSTDLGDGKPTLMIDLIALGATIDAPAEVVA